MSTDSQEIAALAARFDELEKRLAAEVRTRRLVVEAEDGFERVVVDNFGVHVQARPHGDSDPTTGVSLEAHEDQGADGEEYAGLILMAAGHCYGMLQVRSDDGQTGAAMLELDTAATLEPGSRCMGTTGGTVVDHEGLKHWTA